MAEKETDFTVGNYLWKKKTKTWWRRDPNGDWKKQRQVYWYRVLKEEKEND